MVGVAEHELSSCGASATLQRLELAHAWAGTCFDVRTRKRQKGACVHDPGAADHKLGCRRGGVGMKRGQVWAGSRSSCEEQERWPGKEHVRVGGQSEEL
eukprot:118402-Pleurochrysis_carterae.AAC.3